MRTNSIDLTKACAQLMRELRERKGYSVARIADELDIDRRTWQRYEDGTSCPTVAKFIEIYRSLGENSIKPVLEFLFPDIYPELHHHSEADLRNLESHFFTEVAPANMVREFAYIMFASHGSSFYSQLQEWIMLDHLPMEHRYIIAEMIYRVYSMEYKRGNLIKTDCIMPDMESFEVSLADAAATFDKHKPFAYSPIVV